MADNKQTIFDQIDLDINPSGAAGSILASNHNTIAKAILAQAGKYTGAYFTAHKVTTTFSAGTLSWENNALNQTGNFTIKVSQLTADLNDIGNVLSLLNAGSLIHIKDYNGRSGFYGYISHAFDNSDSANTFYSIVLTSFTGNPNYTYQNAETKQCGLSWVNAAPSGGVSDGDKGDITVSSSGATWTIDDNVVTFAKMQDINTTRILGRTSEGVGDPEELTPLNARVVMQVPRTQATSLDPSAAPTRSGDFHYNTQTETLFVADGNSNVSDWRQVTTVRTVKVSLTAAQIKTLNSAPITLVAAQGTGTIIKPIEIVLSYNYGTAVFDNLSIRGQFSASIIPIGVSSITQQSNDVLNYSRASTGSSSLAINQAFILTASADSVATGDGTMDVWLTYEILK